MDKKYWVVGGEYDVQFKRLIDGTQRVAGPFADAVRARTEWQRLTFHDRLLRDRTLSYRGRGGRLLDTAPGSLRDRRLQSTSRADEVLSRDALAFLAALHRRFDGRRHMLLAARAERQARLDRGEVRTSWPRRRTSAPATGASPPLRPTCAIGGRDHRATNAKMVINALIRAREPSWRFRRCDGSAVRSDRRAGQSHRPLARHLGVHGPASGKDYRLAATPPCCSSPARASPRRGACHHRRGAAGGLLFDFGVYLFHNANAALAADRALFLLPKLEGWREAAWWSEVIALPNRNSARARRHRTGHLADRDFARGIRDGRDAVRAEGPCRRPQLRPLGLYLQLHQALRANAERLVPIARR